MTARIYSIIVAVILGASAHGVDVTLTPLQFLYQCS